jgi:hypothetical protein
VPQFMLRLRKQSSRKLSLLLSYSRKSLKQISHNAVQRSSQRCRVYDVQRFPNSSQFDGYVSKRQSRTKVRFSFDVDMNRGM